jgi:hypothetical protein
VVLFAFAILVVVATAAVGGGFAVPGLFIGLLGACLIVLGFSVSRRA